MRTHVSPARIFIVFFFVGRAVRGDYMRLCVRVKCYTRFFCGRHVFVGFLVETRALSREL